MKTIFVPPVIPSAIVWFSLNLLVAHLITTALEAYLKWEQKRTKCSAEMWASVQEHQSLSGRKWFSWCKAVSNHFVIPRLSGINHSLFWILMNSRVLHHFCFLNAVFNTAIKMQRMDKSCLTERTASVGRTKQTSADCTAFPKSTVWSQPALGTEKHRPGRLSELLTAVNISYSQVQDDGRKKFYTGISTSRLSHGLY